MLSPAYSNTISKVPYADESKISITSYPAITENIVTKLTQSQVFQTDNLITLKWYHHKKCLCLCLYLSLYLTLSIVLMK